MSVGIFKDAVLLVGDILLVGGNPQISVERWRSGVDGIDRGRFGHGVAD